MAQSFYLLSLKLRLRQEFEYELFFGQIMPNNSQKHLNKKRLPCKQNKKQFTLHFFEGFVIATNSIQNFKPLRVRVIEITV